MNSATLPAITPFVSVLPVLALDMKSVTPTTQRPTTTKNMPNLQVRNDYIAMSQYKCPSLELPTIYIVAFDVLERQLIGNR